MWRSRWRRWRHRAFLCVPFSAPRGHRAYECGEGPAWEASAESVTMLLDGLVIWFLIVAAGFSLAALAFSSAWFAAATGLFIALSLFLMAAELWVDRELQRVREQRWHNGAR